MISGRRAVVAGVISIILTKQDSLTPENHLTQIPAELAQITFFGIRRGTSYIITLDLNNDGKCYDATLDRLYQLENPEPAGPLMVPGKAVVWSFGSGKAVKFNQALDKQGIVTSF